LGVDEHRIGTFLGTYETGYYTVSVPMIISVVTTFSRARAAMDHRGTLFRPTAYAPGGAEDADLSRVMVGDARAIPRQARKDEPGNHGDGAAEAARGWQWIARSAVRAPPRVPLESLECVLNMRAPTAPRALIPSHVPRIAAGCP
jgi:hypothetical protein